MSEFEKDATLREALREPFPQELIGTLPKAGIALSYVGHAAVTDRLNRVAPGWSYSIDRIVEREINGLPHVLAVIGTITVGGISRPEVGDVDRPSHYGDELKKAISDLIRRGAMRFGVAIDLWSKEDLSQGSSAVHTSTSAADEQPAESLPAGMARARKRSAAASGKAGVVGVPPSAPAPAPDGADWIAPVAIPDGATATQHFPIWKQGRARGYEVCAFPDCSIHPARRKEQP